MPSVIVVTPWTVAARNEMLVVSAFSAEWTEKNGQPGANISGGATRCLAFGKVSAAQLAALMADTRFSVLWSGESDDMPDLSAEAVQNAAALRGIIDNTYHPDIANLATDGAATLADVTAEIVTVNLNTPWESGKPLTAGDVRYYAGNLYEVVQSHTTQADWTPDIAQALFMRWYNPNNEPEPWRQPLGAHDAYRVGQRVTYNGNTWINTIPANVWQPGVTGWTNQTAPATPEWTAGVLYHVNDEVTYQGLLYRCRQQHTSIVTWEPPNVLALWLPI